MLELADKGGIDPLCLVLSIKCVQMLDEASLRCTHELSVWRTVKPRFLVIRKRRRRGFIS